MSTPRKSELLKAQERRRARILSLVTSIFLAMGPIFIFRYYEMGLRNLSVVVVAAMLFAAGVLIWVRRGGNSERGGLFVTSALLVLLIYSNLYSGGFEDPNFGWFYVIPLAAALLVSARVGWVFTGVVLVVALLFWIAPQLGFEIPDYVPEELHDEQSLFNRLATIIAIGVILGALASQQKYARGLLERVNNELTYEMNQRSEMQARMVRSERAASMGSLAAGMAHEINNPLTYVIGNLELLQSRLPQAADGTSAANSTESRTMLSEAIEGAYRVAGLVRDLKTFSHSSEEDIEIVDLGEVLDRAAKMVGNEIRHRAKLEIECEPGLAVLANHGRILQVVINLLTNAAHAIDPGSAEKNMIRVSVREENGRIELEVADTGSGIDPELTDRVFEPFFTTKAVGFGMGMGLSITRNVLQSMGGTIEIRYSSPEGTAFIVTLRPAEEASEASEVDQASAQRARRSESSLKILIIDDEEQVLRYLSASLSHHDVSTQTRGRKAIDEIVQGDFDIIVCDLMMPEMTGMEIHAELKDRCPAAADRMLFMTGGVFVEEAKDFLVDVPGRWIEKPVRHGDLESRIWKCIDEIDAVELGLEVVRTG
ncbi:MAG: hybrid sensor histidine kinase/response regulator [Myxococcota bacterium]|nr:hybrid sensor histidine kinase/response regulator [Myxococcota bacterium]